MNKELDLSFQRPRQDPIELFGFSLVLSPLRHVGGHKLSCFCYPGVSSFGKDQLWASLGNFRLVLLGSLAYFVLVAANIGEGVAEAGGGGRGEVRAKHVFGQRIASREGRGGGGVPVADLWLTRLEHSATWKPKNSERNIL